jgi:flagellar basal body-associated protein FliL
MKRREKPKTKMPRGGSVLVALIAALFVLLLLVRMAVFVMRARHPF